VIPASGGLPRRGRLALAAAMLASGVAGCGGDARRDGGSTVDHRLAAVPLVDLLPSGIELTLAARPSAALSDPAIASLVDAVFPPDAPRRFGDRTGLHLDDVPEAVLAELPPPSPETTGAGADPARGEPSFLVLFRLPGRARDFVEATGRTRMGSVETSAEAPFPRRVGFVGAHRRDVTALDGDTVLVVGGALDAGRAVRGRVRDGAWGPGDAGGLPPDLRDRVVRALSEEPLVLAVPEPLPVAGNRGLALLLARQETLLATASGTSDHSGVVVTVGLTGRFPDSASSNFRTLLESVAATDLGGALGIREGLRTLSLETTDGGIALSIALPVRALRTGLRVLFTGELRDLLGTVP